MPGVLADVPVVWVALALTSTVLVGAAFQFPTTAPAPAAAVADTIDTVAAAPYDSTATHPIAAAAVRLGPHRLAVRTTAGVTHAAIGYGPVTPVPRGSRLARIAAGTPPPHLFGSPTAFQTAVAKARDRTPTWRTDVETIVVRQVTWGGVDVTLVTA
ncbi:MAG: hypothetical protein ABEJ57_00145 [Halobacteriaceae archaeon]